MVFGIPGPSGRSASSPQDWFYSLKPFTRLWFTATLASTILLAAGMVQPVTLAHLPELTFGSLQVWRLITSFCFLGKFSFGFIMNILLLIQYSSKLEESYDGRTSEYVWVFLFGLTFALIANWLFGLAMYFTTLTLVFFVMYIWCRRNPSVQMSVFGLFNISAAFLPFFIMLMSTLMGGGIADILCGIMVGHLFHFLHDLHPWTAEASILKAPAFLRNLIPDETGAVRPTSGGGAVRGANYGQGSWAAAQGNAPPAGAAAGGGAGGGFFQRTTGHSWGEGRRLAD